MEKQAQIQINRFIKNKTLIKKYVVLLLAFAGTALNELLASQSLFRAGTHSAPAAAVLSSVSHPGRLKS